MGVWKIELTVNDPKTYTAPWTIKIDQHLLVNSDLLEFICVDK